MRAVRIHEDGGPEVLVLEEAPDPEPGPGEVLVRLRASALNHLDIWIRKGLPSVPKPRILGADGAGVVEALGDGVTGFDLGERVVLNPGIESGGGRIHVIGEHGDGTNAELIALPATNVYPIPGDLSFEEAAAFPLVFETAYRMLVTRAALRAGEWVLLWGIGGGVSTAGLAIAKALGARTIVTSSSDAKLQRASELGADVVVNHASGDVYATVKEATEGPTSWSEWVWRGTRGDGEPFLMKGVIVLGWREDGLISWARWYMEPVEQAGPSIDAAVRQLSGLSG